MASINVIDDKTPPDRGVLTSAEDALMDNSTELYVRQDDNMPAKRKSRSTTQTSKRKISPDHSIERTVLIFKNQKFSKSNIIALIESHEQQKKQIEMLTHKIKSLEQAHSVTSPSFESEVRLNILETKIDSLSKYS